MTGTNTRAAQVKRLIEATIETGLAVTGIEVTPGKIRLQTEAPGMTHAATSVKKDYATWKLDEMKANAYNKRNPQKQESN